MPTTDRTQWSLERDRCMVCGARDSLETHEIAGGAARSKALEEPATWLRLCRECHQGREGLHAKHHWPLGRALALKKLCDPEHYDRVKVLDMKRLAHTAVTEQEVDDLVEALLIELDGCPR